MNKYIVMMKDGLPVLFCPKDNSFTHCEGAIKLVKAEEAERKIKELREIAERAIFWLDMAALIDADKDNVELYDRKSAQMKEDLERLK